MKQFLQKKAKLVFLCMLVLLTCTACANPRGRDGKTLADQIIASEETTIDVNQINISDITDKAEKKELKKQVKDGKITIPATTFKSSMSHGWFDGLIVWPIAQIINLVSAKTDAGVGIIVTTLLIQMLVFVFTRKSQMSIPALARNLFKRNGSVGSMFSSLYSIRFFMLYLAFGS